MSGEMSGEMSSRSVLFYVSGHGFGHAVRMAEVMLALGRLEPDWRIVVRTQAPPSFFPADVAVVQGEFEPAVVERQAGVVVDEGATRSGLKSFLSRWEDLAQRETEFIRGLGADLIVADIPPIAGEAAWRAGVPAVAISNFTWDWIHEPYAPDLLGPLEKAYARIPVLLRLPFSQPERLEGFSRIVDVPLIARRSEPRGRPGARIRVLAGSRAEISEAALRTVAAEAPEFQIVKPEEGVPFRELFASCDAVVAKLGFSMLAECIAARKPLLYPPRQGFREELLLQAHAASYVPVLAIPLPRFYSGEWGPYLRELLLLPAVETSLRLDGAEVCAGHLSAWLRSPAKMRD